MQRTTYKIDVEVGAAAGALSDFRIRLLEQDFHQGIGPDLLVRDIEIFLLCNGQPWRRAWSTPMDSGRCLRCFAHLLFHWRSSPSILQTLINLLLFLRPPATIQVYGAGWLPPQVTWPAMQPAPPPAGWPANPPFDALSLIELMYNVNAGTTLQRTLRANPPVALNPARFGIMGPLYKGEYITLCCNGAHHGGAGPCVVETTANWPCCFDAACIAQNQLVPAQEPVLWLVFTSAPGRSYSYRRNPGVLPPAVPLTIGEWLAMINTFRTAYTTKLSIGSYFYHIIRPLQGYVPANLPILCTRNNDGRMPLPM
ncbi:hypothetical protein B484DRAFT_458285 [Ochromonadaceae sp. CCMP2298]|nr:hypothetical protein B484DRAFT_458285 [Ochromonadaceae sp. CCMP2298]|mmetsp:Transcript_28719/g.63772  ORF Transcript_28719/g.63772 Transcript_28719/m.63772 type:complete len:311 (-) Transcript_28719:183-1115(-)